MVACWRLCDSDNKVCEQALSHQTDLKVQECRCMLAWPLLRDDLAKVSVLSLEPAAPQTTGTKFSSVLTSVRQIANNFCRCGASAFAIIITIFQMCGFLALGSVSPCAFLCLVKRKVLRTHMRHRGRRPGHCPAHPDAHTLSVWTQALLTSPTANVHSSVKKPSHVCFRAPCTLPKC